MAIDLTQNKDIYAIIIESTFYSMDDLVNRRYWFLPTKLLLKFHFRNDEKVSNIPSPVLIIHSTNDEIIDMSNGERLFDEVTGEKVFLETNGSHNGGFQKTYDLYRSAISVFLKVKQK